MEKITRGWPPSRRKEQADRIREQQPWKQSTGPRTPAGKATTAQNAYDHGFRSEDMQEINDLLAAMRAFAKAVIARQKAQNMLNYPPITLKEK